MIKRTLMATAATAALVGTLATGSALAAGDEEDLEANLSGAAEVPGPGDPDGTGDAEVTIDAEAGEVCFELEWDDIASPTMGHIHQGGPEVAGPVVVPFFGMELVDEIERDDDYEACVEAEPDLLEDIADSPEDYYVNLHNARFPAGVIRGQLQED